MSQPKSLRTLLAHWQPAGERVPLGGEASALAAAWGDAVGEDVARRTRTAGFRDGTLTVITPSSAWSHQLTFLVPTIVQRLTKLCPGIGLRTLRFVVATGRSRALLARGVQPLRSRTTRRNATSDRTAASSGIAGPGSERSGEPETRNSDEPAVWLERLRCEQAQLDRRRLEEGWRRCRSCGSWSPPRETPRTYRPALRVWMGPVLHSREE